MNRVCEVGVVFVCMCVFDFVCVCMCVCFIPANIEISSNE